MKSILIIANREITTRIKTRAWIISTLISIILVCLVVAFNGMQSGDSNMNILQGTMSDSITQMQSITEQATAEAYKQFGITYDEFNALVAQKTNEIATQRGIDVNKSAMDNFWIGYIIAILMYFAIVLTSTQIAMSVAEEKTSSIAEVVLASTTPLKLMSGKILGNGAVGLLQILLIFIPASIVAKAFGIFDISQMHLQSHMLLVIIIGICFFIVGYITYSALFAAFASTVSRMEDVQSAIMPVSIFSMAGFFISIMGGGSGMLSTFVNYTPLLSPFAAVSAFGKDEMEFWQVLISLLISAVFLPILVWFGSKIYSFSILKKGVKLSPFEAFKK